MIGIAILVAIDPDRYGWLVVDKKGRSARKEIEEIGISDLKGLLWIAGEGSIYVQKKTRSTGALNHRQGLSSSERIASPAPGSAPCLAISLGSPRALPLGPASCFWSDV
jgi:hypothetical protein